MDMDMDMEMDMDMAEKVLEEAGDHEVENNNNHKKEEQVNDKIISKNNKNMEERKTSWAKLRRVDSLHLEAGRVSMSTSHHHHAVSGVKGSWRRTLTLAFQSIGIVYGDIGTSPLYVFSSTFTKGRIDHQDDILGVLSLIIYTIALIPMLKYVFIVLFANDNGDGGTFALYSLICRYAKVSFIPNYQPEDTQLSNYNLETPSNQLRRALNIKHMLEKSHPARLLLFLVAITGTSMVIGDGVLTPSISVLSAVSGIKSLGQDVVVVISIAILVILFSVQRFGTDKVGSSFAPIIFVWFSLLAGIGLFNLFKYDIGVLRAFNPYCMIEYMKRNGRQGWVSLGGVFLCITGTEAMFADLGHFNIQAIQLSFSCITFPALLTAYAGQAAYLRKFPNEVGDTFYKSIPTPLYWPMFVVAVAASIIASQAMISGAFSIISQSLSLGCFPRVKVVHTSAKYEGQVYIPEINYSLMIACVIVTAVFKTTDKIGNAYGIAVVTVMVLTTCLVTLIMLVIWKTSIWLIALFFVVFGSIELTYMSSVMYKFTQGGFLPLVFSLFLMIIMWIWHYVHKERYMFELRNKVSAEYVRDLASSPNINRVPGMGLLYSELVQGIPPIFTHFITHIPSIHSVLVVVSIKSIPISKVALEERFLFRQVDPKEYHMFRCVVRYGYNDVIGEPKEFEQQLLEQLKEFISYQSFITEAEQLETKDENKDTDNGNDDHKARRSSSSTVHVEEVLPSASRDDRASISSGSSANNSIRSVNKSSHSSSGIVVASGPMSGVAKWAEEEMEFVQQAMEKGVVYLLGETQVVASQNSSLLKKVVVNYAYSFLRKNFRQGEKVMAIPSTRLLRVGMTYEI